MKDEVSSTFKIPVGTLVGTSLMTAFSYYISQHEKDQFREPVLLNILSRRLMNTNQGNYTGAFGWLAHYGVGALFVSAYDKIWKQSGRPTLWSGLLLGAISGVVGIATWKLVFKLHPSPPTIDFKDYYRQLFVAHLIFGASAALGYKTFANNLESTKNNT
jgi:hypothetical protein